MGKSKIRTIETTSPEKLTALQAIFESLPGISGHQQRARALAALQIGPVTSYELMRFLDCFDPRPRILELRAQGHLITLNWVHALTESGEAHRIGQYVLTPGGPKQ